MLVLSRQSEEQIRVGEHIKIVVLGIRGQRVQIGIECPKSTIIRRAESNLEERQNGIGPHTPVKSTEAQPRRKSSDRKIACVR